MKCPKCGNSRMLVEAIDSKTKRYKCKDCGFNEVRDERGAPLLTEVPREQNDQLLG